ncbi:MAG: TetR/AcrR family transcriptional regulator, cholesterol catabolism regulator [Microbacteriaceae bacterium]|nr:TetR/AcrR family transcriptional regulator, cholesterol catabolism regulator [Microbacteriaceae bacterium]
MRDIAQEANLALGTVYRYFPSKELLLAYVFEEWCEGYWERLAETADGRANVDRLIELSRRSVEAYANEPNIHAMITSLQLSTDPAVIALMSEITQRAARFFLDNIKGLDEPDAVGVVEVVFAVMGAKLGAWGRGLTTIADVYTSMEKTVRLLLEFRDPKMKK